MAMDFSQARPHPLIESTSRNIYILGLNLHLRTTLRMGPFGCMPEKRDAYPARLREDTDIP